MRHRRKKKILGRTAQPRGLMIRNLASSLILYEKIKTTEAKAKIVRALVDKAIIIGKRNDVNARRALNRLLPVPNAVKKIIEELSPRYSGRSSGCSRIIKLNRRAGDAAKMASLELVE